MCRPSVGRGSTAPGPLRDSLYGPMGVTPESTRPFAHSSVGRRRAATLRAPRYGGSMPTLVAGAPLSTSLANP